MPDDLAVGTGLFDFSESAFDGVVDFTGVLGSTTVVTTLVVVVAVVGIFIALDVDTALLAFETTDEELSRLGGRSLFVLLLVTTLTFVNVRGVTLTSGRASVRTAWLCDVGIEDPR